MTCTLATDPVPISGEVQFWRLPPDQWAPILDTVHDLGIRHVATYLSWRRHESRRGALDFTSAHLNLPRFLGLCAERGLNVHLKPGPWICAEEPGGGLPDWLLAEQSLTALDHAGQPVIGYNPPFRHPVPSYAASRYRTLAAQWLTAVWQVVADHARPGGIIDAIQLDNEPSLAFQDAMYRFDYHPEALERFRDFTLARHGDLTAVSQAWGCPLTQMSDLQPPRPGHADVLGGHERDWIAYHEHYISDYLVFLRQTIVRLGGNHLTATVNLNTHPVRGLPQSGTHIVASLQAADPGASIVVGEDHYFEPPVDGSDLAQLDLGAALGMRSGTHLVWAPELQAGIWRSPGEEVDYPDPLEGELAAWWGLSFAYGYQGFNLYMLVNRENWQYAPIDEQGRLGPGAPALRNLISALRRISDLREYRPQPAANLIWDRHTQESAYAALGTQAHPSEPWTRKDSTRAWDETLHIAQSLTTAGIPYKLCSSPADLDERLPTYGPLPLREEWAFVDLTPVTGIRPASAPVRAVEPGVEARLLSTRRDLSTTRDDQIVVVVAWRRGRSNTHTTVRTRNGWDGRLVDVLTGEVVSLSGGRATVRMPPLGTRIFTVEASSGPDPQTA